MEDYEHRLATLEQKIDRLASDVEDLVTAWKAAAWLVGAVKWLGAISAALTSVYIATKGFDK